MSGRDGNKACPPSQVQRRQKSATCRRLHVQREQRFDFNLEEGEKQKKEQKQNRRLP